MSETSDTPIIQDLESDEDEVVETTFSEASATQQTLCQKLAALHFHYPLSQEGYVSREEFLSAQPLAKDGGIRFWNVVVQNEPKEVIATCKTIRREFLIKDENGLREERGYCIATVMTDPDYREMGMATSMLGDIVSWADGEGDAPATMLYSDLGKDFYAKLGWKAFPAWEISLWPYQFARVPQPGHTSTSRILKKEYIDVLCQKDVENLRAQFADSSIRSNEIKIAILPTHDLVTWLHSRAEFLAQNIYGSIPEAKGSISDKYGIWIYWYHDFRERYLAIQRIARSDCSPVDTLQQQRVLARLFSDALNEAKAWKLRKVVIWSPDELAEGAARVLNEDMGVEFVKQERVREHIPSLRLRAGNIDRNIVWEANEFYAWA